MASVAKDVFVERGIGADQFPAASPPLLRLDEAAETDRATRVKQQRGVVMPGLVQYTTDALFRDLWLRPDLAPRDRSLVTVSALIGVGPRRADAVSLESGDGSRPDADAGRRGHHAISTKSSPGLCVARYLVGVQCRSCRLN